MAWLERSSLRGLRITYEELEDGRGVPVIVTAVPCLGDGVWAFSDELLVLIEGELELVEKACSLVVDVLLGFRLALVVIDEPLARVEELDFADGALPVVNGVLPAFGLALIVIDDGSDELLTACDDTVIDFEVLSTVAGVVCTGLEELTTNNEGPALDEILPIIDEDPVAMESFATEEGVFLT
jgi:hypothetical protein